MNKARKLKLQMVVCVMSWVLLSACGEASTAPPKLIPPTLTPSLVPPTFTPILSPTPLPLPVTIAVPANAGWIGTGLILPVGQSILITSEGVVDYVDDDGLDANASDSDSDGDGSSCDKAVIERIIDQKLTLDCLLTGASWGALVGRVGEDGTPFLIGYENQFTIESSGELFLGVNDCCNFADNSGEFKVTVSAPASTPTPKIYTLRIVFSTTSDWSNLRFLYSSEILDARLVDKQGDLTHFSVDKAFLSINQTLADAQALKEVGITVDFDISGNTTIESIPFLLQKGAINNSAIGFYNVLDGTKYRLLDEVYRVGYVEGNADLNPYNFSFDLEPLFQDVAAIATRTQNEILTGKLIFDYSSIEYRRDFPDEKGDTNVFTANVDGTNLIPVTNMEGFNFLKDVSPDGTKALIVSAKDWNSKTANLYLVGLKNLNSEPVKLAQGLPFVSYQFNRSAMWLDNTKLMYIGQGEKGFGIYKINADGTSQINIERGNPFEILAVTPERIYWSTYVQIPYLNGHKDAFFIWFTDLNTHETGQLKYKGESISVMYNKNAAAISPDGTKIAWVDLATPEDPQDFRDYFLIASLSDIDNTLVLEAGPSQIKWRLDGKSILGVSGGKTDTSRGTYGLFEISAESATVIKNYHLGDDILGGTGSPLIQCSNISTDSQLWPCLTFEANRDAEGHTPAKLIFINLETASYIEVRGIKFFFLTWTPRTMILLH